MIRVLMLSIAFTLCITAVGLFVAPLIAVEQDAATSTTPVLVELFTSQGCSSCPPADDLLRALSEQPIGGVEIIALSWHVDYWNRLGWKDPYSSKQASSRQEAYAHALNTGRLYTPQMVVDGAAEFVGSDRKRAYDAIRVAAKREKIPLELTQERSNGEAVIRVRTKNDVPVSEWNVMIAITEDDI